MLTLELVLRLLPELEELEGLRAALVRAGVPDPAIAWSRSRAFETVDRRVVERGRLMESIDQAEQAYREYGDQLFASYRAVLEALQDGRSGDAVRELAELARLKEEAGLFESARRYLEAALVAAEPLPDKGPHVLVLQRLARVCRSAGDLEQAGRLYARSGDLARDVGDTAGEVAGRIGQGYSLALAGRWPEAERLHHAALGVIEAAGGEHALQAGQIYNNLGYFAARQARLPEAEEWLDRAGSVWSRIRSERDLAVYHHCRALVRKASGDPDGAREAYRAALDLPLPAAVRAGIAVDLAEVCLDAGDREGAERWGRAAEEDAVLSRSPYLLGRVYQVRGNVARLSGDEDGFVFYEKALEIARDRGLSLLEGETLLDYSELRARMGEAEEARSYLERAREIFMEAGASAEQDRARELMSSVTAIAMPDGPPLPGEG